MSGLLKYCAGQFQVLACLDKLRSRRWSGQMRSRIAGLIILCAAIPAFGQYGSVYSYYGEGTDGVVLTAYSVIVGSSSMGPIHDYSAYAHWTSPNGRTNGWSVSSLTTARSDAEITIVEGGTYTQSMENRAFCNEYGATFFSNVRSYGALVYLSATYYENRGDVSGGWIYTHPSTCNATCVGPNDLTRSFNVNHFESIRLVVTFLTATFCGNPTEFQNAGTGACYDAPLP